VDCMNLRCACRSTSALLRDGMDREAEVSGDFDCAALSPLEITRGKATARGELVRGAEYRFRWVAASVPDEFICRGRGEAVLGEEALRA